MTEGDAKATQRERRTSARRGWGGRGNWAVGGGILLVSVAAASWSTIWPYLLGTVVQNDGLAVHRDLLGRRNTGTPLTALLSLNGRGQG
ncbi:hypothetical protein ACTWP5_25720 [Streptomyces sp. 4N509B]|uniref:hypothetical protein n=1 Tax=Streptomyces sp. 4N509B TaxID=3457413 RepID=UPI003FD45977